MEKKLNVLIAKLKATTHHQRCHAALSVTYVVIGLLLLQSAANEALCTITLAAIYAALCCHRMTNSGFVLL